MTFKVALLFLAAWLFGVVVLGIDRVGTVIHVLLLGGLMLLLAAVLKALDAANGRSDSPAAKR